MKNILFACLIVALSACKTVSQNNHMNNKAAPEALPEELKGKKVFATAILDPRSGSKVHAKAWFIYSQDGVHVFVKAQNLAPGLHGIHIHEKGDCSAPDASSAGGHYNPEHLIHGAPDPRLHHIGDFGNIQADMNGHGILNLFIPRKEFYPGFDWNKIIGRSIIIHGGTDDLITQPTGNSGNRVACGVIIAH